MAYAVTEADDDAARLEKTRAQFLGLTVTKLMAIKADLTAIESSRVREWDTQINVFGKMPSDHDVAQIKKMAWQHRRRLPATVAPKLPPHDPIVQEQGLA